MPESRKDQRWPAYLGAQAIFNGRSTTFDCLVRNISSRGARLVFKSPAALPSEFELAIPKRDEARQVRIAWRRELEAGVMFLDRGAASVISIETARKLRTLQTERDALARRVAQLSEPS